MSHVKPEESKVEAWECAVTHGEDGIVLPAETASDSGDMPVRGRLQALANQFVADQSPAAHPKGRGAPGWLDGLSVRLLISGRDLTVRGIEPHVGLCTDGVEPAGDSLSLCLCPFPTLSLKMINLRKKLSWVWGTTTLAGRAPGESRAFRLTASDSLEPQREPKTCRPSGPQREVPGLWFPTEWPFKCFVPTCRYVHFLLF